MNSTDVWCVEVEVLVKMLQSISKRKRYGAHPRYMQGEEAEQQQLMDLCQVSDSGAEKSHQKHGHVPGPSSFISRRTNAVSGGILSVGSRQFEFSAFNKGDSQIMLNGCRYAYSKL